LPLVELGKTPVQSEREGTAMAVFEKRTASDGTISYRARVRVKGHPAQSKTFDRLTDARAWARRIELEIQEGRACPAAGRHTFGELVDRYLCEFLPKKSEAMQEVQAYHLRWWKKQMGSYLLSDITPALIIEHRAKLELGKVHGGTTRCPATCNRYMAALRHMFSIAVRDWEWMQDNPAKRVTTLREPRGRVRCLNDDERERLLEASKQSRSPYLYPVVILALSTGMRFNEILTLTWSQISFADRAIALLKTKNGKPRRVPLEGEALEILKAYSRVRRLGTDLLFPGRKDPKRPADIHDAWDNAVARAGLENFRFHDLRHTAASYYAMSGAAARDLCDIFGWQTMQMAMRYAHLFDSHTSELAAKMNEKFLSKTNEAKRLLNDSLAS